MFGCRVMGVILMFTSVILVFWKDIFVGRFFDYSKKICWEGILIRYFNERFETCSKQLVYVFVVIYFIDTCYSVLTSLNTCIENAVCVWIGVLKNFVLLLKILQNNPTFFLDLCARDRAFGDQLFLLFGLIAWRLNVCCLFNVWFRFLFICYKCQK